MSQTVTLSAEKIKTIKEELDGYTKIVQADEGKRKKHRSGIVEVIEEFREKNDRYFFVHKETYSAFIKMYEQFIAVARKLADASPGVPVPLNENEIKVFFIDPYDQELPHSDANISLLLASEDGEAAERPFCGCENSEALYRLQHSIKNRLNVAVTIADLIALYAQQGLDSFRGQAADQREL